MKKSELQEHSEEYYRRMQIALTAESNGFYREAIDWAVSAWPFIDGMMQFERRYNEKDFDSIDAIEIVLKYAPVLLSLGSLEKLEKLLSERRRIERDTEANLAIKLRDARDDLFGYYKIWKQIESGSASSIDELVNRNKPSKKNVEKIVDFWKKMGLVKNIADDSGQQKILLILPLNEIGTGICASCGTKQIRKVSDFLVDLECSTCNCLRSHIIS